MKIGILTYHKAINYGALFQNYALIKVLESMGASCETIDYESEYFKEYYKIIKIKDTSIKKILKTILLYKNDKIKRNKFQKFIKNNIKLSEMCTTKQELEKLNDIYDIFITGSDQIWNLGLSNGDKNYFLDFVKDENKKQSYAASLGLLTLNDSEKSIYKELLKDFKNISVREESAKLLLESILKNKKIRVDLEPTLLIEKKTWERLCVNSQEGDYILLFTFFYSTSILNFVEKLSKETNLKIVTIGNAIIKRKILNYKRNVGPEEFLGLIKNAKYVVTDSFHGTAFSINFNKEFFVQMPESGKNPRINSLTNMLNIKNREIIDSKLNGKYSIIDYNEVNKILSIERKKSLDYLEKIVNEQAE